MTALTVQDLMDSELQLQPLPEKFFSTLLELRDYYLPLVQQYEKLYMEAVENLNHAEALLSNWSSGTDVDSQPPNIDMNSEPLTAPAPENSSQDDNFNNSNNLETAVQSVKPNIAAPPVTDNLEIDNLPSTKQDIQLTLFTPEPNISAQVNLSPDNIETANNPETENLSSDHEDINLPVIISEPIVNVLEDLSSDDSSIRIATETKLVDSNPMEVEVAKMSDIEDSSSTSIQSDEQSQATSSSQKKISQTTNKYKKENAISLVAEFKGKNLMDAICWLLRKNVGRVFSVVEVVNYLYGELNGEDLKQIKKRVVKELSRGHRTGRFSRVPRTIGIYTWDTHVLPSDKRKQVEN